MLPWIQSFYKPSSSYIVCTSSLNTHRLSFCGIHFPSGASSGKASCYDSKYCRIATMGPIGSGFLEAMPGPQQVLQVLTGSLSLSSLSNPEITSSESSFQQCGELELSCQTSYHGQDTCCFNYPGGQMLQTQFWDADPAIGPKDSWTIHGLW